MHQPVIVVSIVLGTHNVSPARPDNRELSIHMRTLVSYIYTYELVIGYGITYINVCMCVCACENAMQFTKCSPE